MIDEPTIDIDAHLTPSSPFGHRLMFLAFTLLAFCLFAPTALLPALDEHCKLLAEERRLHELIAELDRQVEHGEELTYAFANDAMINERLAVLDLRYRKPDEVVVPVLAPSGQPVAPAATAIAAAADADGLAIPDDWPWWTRAVNNWAHQRGLVDLFRDDSLRPVFLLMSCGLLVAAFILFAPRIRVRPGQPTSPPHDCKAREPATTN